MTQICDLFFEEKHKSREGILDIVNLAYMMNGEGRHRRITKFDLVNYLTIFNKVKV